MILLIGAVLGTLIGIRVQSGVREAADELARLDFSLAATQRAALVREALRAPAERLDTLARFFENSDVVEPLDFAGFIYPWLTSKEGLRFAAFSKNGTRLLGALDGNLYKPIAVLAKECDAGRLAAADIIGNLDGSDPRLVIVRSMKSRDARMHYLVVVADVRTRVRTALQDVDTGNLQTSILQPGREKPIERFDDNRQGTAIAPKIDQFDLVPFLSYTEAVEISGIGLEIHVNASRKYLHKRKSALDFFIIPAFTLLFALLAYAAVALLRRGDRADRLRRQALNNLEHFFSLDLDLFCITDAEYRFLRVNPTWERTFGFFGAELIGTSLLDFVHPDDRENALQAIMPNMRKNAIASFLTKVQRKDGQCLRIEWKLATVGNNCYAAARDVTEREEYEARLRKTLSEKETLLREVHHRVKNNMQIISSLLNLQSRDLNDPKIAETLESAQGRIRTMAMVHDALYHSTDFTDIDFDEYASNIASACVYGLDRRNCIVEVRPSGIALGLDLAIPCGLLLNELVSNSARYAFAETDPTRISIELHESNGTLELIVKDNGKGFEQNLDINKDGGLGLKLVTSLAAQLHGTVRKETGPGTQFKIVFNPLPGSFIVKG